MMSRRVRIRTLSSVSRVFNNAVFTIPFRAAMICGPCIFTGIPTLVVASACHSDHSLGHTIGPRR